MWKSPKQDVYLLRRSSEATRWSEDEGKQTCMSKLCVWGWGAFQEYLCDPELEWCQNWKHKHNSTFHPSLFLVVLLLFLCTNYKGWRKKMQWNLDFFTLFAKHSNRKYDSGLWNFPFVFTVVRGFHFMFSLMNGLIVLCQASVLLKLVTACKLITTVWFVILCFQKTLIWCMTFLRPLTTRCF